VARAAEMPSLRGVLYKMDLLCKVVCAPYKLCSDPPLGGGYYISGGYYMLVDTVLFEGKIGRCSESGPGIISICLI
jgi:hypothetical protein